MSKHRVRNFSSSINPRDTSELALDKARAILEVLLNTNLKECSTLTLSLCLVVVDDLLEANSYTAR